MIDEPLLFVVVMRKSATRNILINLMNIWTMLTWLELVAMILRAFEAWKLRFFTKPQTGLKIL